MALRARTAPSTRQLDGAHLGRSDEADELEIVRFVAIADAYHGNTIGIRALFRHTIKPPLDERALDRLETALKRRDVAAFVMEPVICNLGVVVPTREFMRGAGELCARYGTLFIADEVASGFGRTGKLFATEHYELEPDILCMFPCAAEVRVKGLAIAIEFDDEDYAGELGERCRERGLLVSSDGKLAMLFPALTVDAETVAAALDVIATAAG